MRYAPVALDRLGPCPTRSISIWCRAWLEADEESTDPETVITGLLDGQYSNPVRIIAFNTAENWSGDVSQDIADELGRRLAFQGRDSIPELRQISTGLCSCRYPSAAWLRMAFAVSIVGSDISGTVLIARNSPVTQPNLS